MEANNSMELYQPINPSRGRFGGAMGTQKIHEVEVLESSNCLKSYGFENYGAIFLFLDGRDFRAETLSSVNHVDILDSPKTIGWNPNIT